MRGERRARYRKYFEVTAVALTPEDVVNKRFQPTKFREGYDQDEVDDFLDEVVVELRRLVQENDELRQRLIASDSHINELQRSGAQTQAAPGQAPPAQGGFMQQEPTPVAAPVATVPMAAAAQASVAPPTMATATKAKGRTAEEEMKCKIQVGGC